MEILLLTELDDDDNELLLELESETFVVHFTAHSLAPWTASVAAK